MLLENRPKSGQVGVPLKKMSRKKDFLFCVHFVGKPLKLENSRCCCADNVIAICLSACCTCSTLILCHSINHIIVFWRYRWFHPRILGRGGKEVAMK